MTTLIQLRAAQPYPPGTVELTPISLAIEAGTVVGVSGEHRPNQEAYLRMIAGIDPVADGVVDHVDPSGGGSLYGMVGFVTWRVPLVAVFDGVTNVTLPTLYHRRETAAVVEERARRLLGAIDYQADHRVLPAFMTPLQRMHLLIARALMLQPAVLCLEEPFFGLDPWARDRMAEYLNTLKASGLALVIVTRDLDFLSRHADHLLFVDQSGARPFADWPSFVECGEPAVTRFFDLACRDCRAVQRGDEHG